MSDSTFTEVGNAERFEDEFQGKHAWTKSTDWLVYKDGKWSRDTRGDVTRAMIYIIKTTEDSKEGTKWMVKSSSSKVINGSLTVAKNLNRIAKSISRFDAQPSLFNCNNGTINLETGEFHPHRPEDYLTKTSGIVYDPDATCPQFDKFISDVMAGKEQMRLFLQRAVGYTLSAHTSETAMFIPYGTGGTGKSQFLNVMHGIMGDYASVAGSDMFVAKHGDAGQPFEMAGREGTRALFASETSEGKRLDVAKVKKMTGNDPIEACYKGKEAYKFVPHWKIWLATNDKPVVSAGDEAIWDRLKLIPFDVRFRNQPGQVKDIGDRLLREESSGILNWCLRGYEMWKEQGLNYPKEIIEAVANWRDSEDYLQRFLEEFTESTSNQEKFVKRSELFSKFTAWAKDSKEGRWLTDKQFVEHLEKKGFVSKPVKQMGKSSRCWLNLALSDPLSRFTHRELDKLESIELDTLIN